MVDWLAMLQFSMAAGSVLGLCVWLLYFLFIRPAVRKKNLQSLGQTSMSIQNSAEEVQMLGAFRALSKERKVIAVKLLQALK